MVNDIEEVKGEITLEDLFKLFKRGKRLIFISTFIGFFIGVVNAYTTQKIWKGEFQIVLEDNKDITSNLLADNAILKSFASRRGISGQLNTEIEKLKSPSVLMNTFNFVKDQNIIKDKTSNLRFFSWRKSLDIKLEPGTKVLNISYQDNDKKLILPVLKKISNDYQKYSGKKRMETIANETKYFENQISIFKEKSFNSIAETVDYADKYDLRIVNNQILKNKDSLKSSDIFTSIEYLRVEAANNLKIIDQQLETIKLINPKDDKVIYFAKNLKKLNSKVLLSQIKDLDLKLTSARVVFKEKDELIKSFLMKRESLIEMLYNQSLGFLETQREDYESLIKTYARPKGVLKKYRQLLNDSVKDQKILDSLESGYRALMLEKAKVNQPWELITEPTLLPNAVSPNKKIHVLIGIFIGFLFGTALRVIDEKRKDIIYSSVEVKNILRIPTLLNLSTSNDDEWQEIFSLLIQNKNIKFDGDIFVIYLGNFKNSFILEKLSDSFKKVVKNNKIIFTDKLSQVSSYKNALILIKLGDTKREDVFKLKNKISLLNDTFKFLMVLN